MVIVCNDTRDPILNQVNKKQDHFFDSLFLPPFALVVGIRPFGFDVDAKESLVILAEGALA
jgi:hypothetical protein